MFARAVLACCASNAVMPNGRLVLLGCCERAGKGLASMLGMALTSRDARGCRGMGIGPSEFDSRLSRSSDDMVTLLSCKFECKGSDLEDSGVTKT